MRIENTSNVLLTDNMAMYLNQISKHKLLSKNDEQQLGRLMYEAREALLQIDFAKENNLSLKEIEELKQTIKLGQEAEKKFVEANLRLVVSIAKNRSRDTNELLEMIQEGNIGLIEAVRRFDYRRGFKFSTYATYWIKQAINKGWSDSRQPLTLPRYIRHRIICLKSAQRDLHITLGHEPNIDELSEFTGWSTREVQKLIFLQESSVSIDQSIGKDQDSEKIENFIETYSDYQSIDRIDEIEYLFECANLDDREKEVLRLYFGIGLENEEYNSKEIAKMIGKSDSYVSYTIRSARAKILSIADSLVEFSIFIDTKFYRETH